MLLQYNIIIDLQTLPKQDFAILLCRSQSMFIRIFTSQGGQYFRNYAKRAKQSAVDVTTTFNFPVHLRVPFFQFFSYYSFGTCDHTCGMVPTPLTATSYVSCLMEYQQCKTIATQRLPFNNNNRFKSFAQSHYAS